MENDNTNAMLDELSARVTAQEFALKLLMMTHPRSDAVGRLWDMYLPTQIDEWTENASYMANARGREALHRHMAALREMLDIDVPGFAEDDES